MIGVNIMNTKLIAKNPTAYHNYDITDKLESGVVLSGTEIKSIRSGQVNLKDTYAIIRSGEIYIIGMHISPYEKGKIFNRDPLRPKKLLMHKKEIQKLTGKIAEKGYTIVPVQVYFKGSLVKVQVALAKGKKLYDKRAVQAKKDSDRAIERAMKGNY